MTLRKIQQCLFPNPLFYINLNILIFKVWPWEKFNSVGSPIQFLFILLILIFYSFDFNFFFRCDLEKNSTVLVPQSPPPATAKDCPTIPTAGPHLNWWTNIIKPTIFLNKMVPIWIGGILPSTIYFCKQKVITNRSPSELVDKYYKTVYTFQTKMPLSELVDKY